MPALTSATKLLCFDLESNGLHGEVFVVGAVIMDAQGNIHDEFTGRAKLHGAVDPWVEKNVIPAVKDVPVTYMTYKALRDAFWNWFVKAQGVSDYVLVSNGYPVEYRFLIQCQEDDLEERYWQHPFPILDLSSIMLMLGPALATKNKIVASVVKNGKFARHHPLNDAKISALAAFEVFNITKRI